MKKVIKAMKKVINWLDCNTPIFVFPFWGALFFIALIVIEIVRVIVYGFGNVEPLLLRHR